METRQYAKSFLTTREFAEAMGLTANTVRLWIKHGKIQAKKSPGGQILIAHETLQAILPGRAVQLGGTVVPVGPPVKGATPKPPKRRGPLPRKKLKIDIPQAGPFPALEDIAVVQQEPSREEEKAEVA